MVLVKFLSSRLQLFNLSSKSFQCFYNFVNRLTLIPKLIILHHLLYNRNLLVKQRGRLIDQLKLILLPINFTLLESFLHLLGGLKQQPISFLGLLLQLLWCLDVILLYHDIELVDFLVLDPEIVDLSF